jgi:hypothetical protein
LKERKEANNNKNSIKKSTAQVMARGTIKKREERKTGFLFAGLLFTFPPTLWEP